MRINAAEIADKPPRGATIVRASGFRAESAGAIENRCITFVASDPSVGRDGHTIAADAWETGDYLKNPVVLFGHADDEPPIGKCVALRTVGNQLRATIQFAAREVYEFADVVFRLVKEGYLNAVSVGWLPLQWTASKDRNRPGGIDFTKVSLLEISIVPVPALPTALATARAAGIDIAPFGAWAERALDSRRRPIPEKELVMVRNVAGGARAYAAPHSSIAERQAAADRLAAVHARPRADPASGFRSLGEFLQTVVRAATAGGAGFEDRRLTRAPSGMAELDATTGGFLVPPVYVDALVASIYEESTIAPLCEQFETERPGEASLPGVSETSRADGSRWGGAVAYWAAEAANVPTSFPRWRNVKFGNSKLIAACAATNELLADAPVFEAYVKRAFAAELSFKLDAAILMGPGAGVPRGIVGSSGLITAPKVTGQASATIVSENISAMWARLPAPSRKRAVWLVNEDVETQLEATSGGGLSPAVVNLYTAAGAAGNATPLLKGRPLIVIEQAPALGATGDIVLADLSQYAVVSAPMRMDISLDVQFLSDQGVLRFTWRVDGAPLWATPITPYNGGATRSPFVALAAR
jgi:HK97 family phage major capsid protein